MNERPETTPIEIGERYEFVSEVEEETLPLEQRLRQYTGQQALVLARVEEVDEECSPLYKVRFDDGREAEAWEEELNGWDKTLGQFFAPLSGPAYVSDAMRQSTSEPDVKL